jgi:hypothetical protein
MSELPLHIGQETKFGNEILMAAQFPVKKGRLKGIEVATREGVGENVRFRCNVLAGKTKIMSGREPEYFTKKIII